MSAPERRDAADEIAALLVENAELREQRDRALRAAEVFVDALRVTQGVWEKAADVIEPLMAEIDK